MENSELNTHLQSCVFKNVRYGSGKTTLLYGIHQI
jgi:hypothetical protein